MEIIIVGCGKVGASLAEQLNREGYNITIVDTDEEKVRGLSSDLDMRGVTGNGTMIEVLEKAGVRDADVFIATTSSDEVNMLCCLLAKKKGHCKTIARIRNIEYEKELEYLRKELDLALTISPEKLCAYEVLRLLKFPAAVEVETFGRGKVEIVKIEVTEDGSICNWKLRDLPKHGGVHPLICLIERNGETFIPTGDSEIKAGDLISYLAKANEAPKFAKECNPHTEEYKSIFLIGAGKVGQYIAQKMLYEHRLDDLKVIDSNKAACEQFAERFPAATVICGNGSEKAFLLEEGIQNADVVLSMTGMDEQNLMLGFVLKGISNAYHIAKVNHFNPVDIPAEFNIGTIVCPKTSACDEVVRFLRGIEDGNGAMESLYRTAKGRVEALEFRITENSEVTNVPLAELHVKKGVLIGGIIRANEVIKPTGQDVLMKNDSVIVIAMADAKIRSIEDITE